MKRLLTILLISFFLHAGIAHALANCFEAAGGAHEPMHKLAIGESAILPNAEHEEPASIHCAGRQLEFGLIVQSSREPLSKRHSAKPLGFAWFDSAAYAGIEQSAARPKAFLLTLISPQSHSSVYIVLSVLRI